MEYTFTLNVNDVASQKIKGVQNKLNNLKPGAGLDKSMSKIRQGFGKLNVDVNRLTKTYDRNRQGIIGYQRQLLTADKERQKQIRHNIRLLQQENRETKEILRSNAQARGKTGGTIDSKGRNSFQRLTDRAGGSFNKLSEKINKVKGVFTKLAVVAGTLMVAFKVISHLAKAADVQLQAEAAVKVGIKRRQNIGVGSPVSEKQAIQYASDIQKQTTFGDEEVLQKVTRSLLRFDEIGAGSFQNIQLAIVDMAANTGQDIGAIADKVGRAMQDPVEMLRQIERYTGKFTEAEKKKIKELTERGRRDLAQAVILEKLNKAFKGSAKVMAETGLGPVKQLKNAFGDLKEELGMNFIPAIQVVSKILRGIVEATTWTFNILRTSIWAVLDNIRQIWDNTLGKILNTLIDTTKEIDKEYTKIGEIWKQLNDDSDKAIEEFNKKQKGGIKWLGRFTDMTIDGAKKAFSKLGEFLKNAWQQLLNIQFIKDLITDVKYEFYLIKLHIAVWFNDIKWWFQDTFGGIFKDIKEAWDNFVGSFEEKFPQTFAKLQQIFEYLSKAINDIFSYLGRIFKKYKLDTLDYSRTSGGNTNALDKLNALRGQQEEEDDNKPSKPPANLGIKLTTDRSVKNYHLTVGSLIEEMIISTTNFTQSETEIQNIVTRMLNKAVLDVQNF